MQLYHFTSKRAALVILESGILPHPQDAAPDAFPVVFLTTSPDPKAARIHVQDDVPHPFAELVAETMPGATLTGGDDKRGFRLTVHLSRDDAYPFREWAFDTLGEVEAERLHGPASGWADWYVVRGLIPAGAIREVGVRAVGRVRYVAFDVPSTVRWGGPAN